MIDFGSESGRTDLVEANVFGKLERKTIGTDSAVEGDEHLALLSIADTLNVTEFGTNTAVSVTAPYTLWDLLGNGKNFGMG